MGQRSHSNVPAFLSYSSTATLVIQLPFPSSLCLLRRDWRRRMISSSSAVGVSFFRSAAMNTCWEVSSRTLQSAIIKYSECNQKWTLKRCAMSIWRKLSNRKLKQFHNVKGILHIRQKGCTYKTIIFWLLLFCVFVCLCMYVCVVYDHHRCSY